jgi:hypothetical protein
MFLKAEFCVYDALSVGVVSICEVLQQRINDPVEAQQSKMKEGQF